MSESEKVRDEWCAEYVIMRDRHAKLVAALKQTRKFLEADEEYRAREMIDAALANQQSTEKP